MNENNFLGQCPACRTRLELVGRDVACPACPSGLDALNAEVDADARLRLWITNNPYVPDSLSDFIVPKHGHLIEVDGIPFDSLADAEEYARVGPGSSRPLTIYCYTANQKKAVSQ